LASGVFACFKITPQAQLNLHATFRSAVLSFSLEAEADFSFAVPEVEPGAARAEPAALAQVLAWLPASAEEELAYSELAVVSAAGVLAAELVVGAAAAELACSEPLAAALVCFEPAAALAEDALAAELVAGAAGAQMGPACSEPAVVSAVGAPAAEPVVVAAALELACSELAGALAEDALAAELVAGAAEAPLELVCSEPAEVFAAAAQVWPQADSGVVGFDSVEHFAAPRLVAALHWVAALDSAVALR
jgi:hypothetical protein